MPPKTHRIYSPSKSSIWMNCAASIKMSEGIEDVTNPAADYGSETHELGERYIKERLGLSDFDEETKSVEELVKSFKYYDLEMEEIANAYADFVVGLVEEEKSRTGFNPVVLVEQSLTLETQPEIGGTLDLGIISSDGVLTIVDLKTGRLKVEAGDGWMETPNSQLGIYGLMAYRTFSKMYKIESIVLRIFQPRIKNYPVYEMTVYELLSWEKEILLPAVDETKVEMPIARTGSHCKYCLGRFRCVKRYKENIEVYENRPINVTIITDEEVESLLPKLDEMVQFASDVKEYALKKMLTGVKYKGYKLVETQTRRKITDEAKVAEIVSGLGYDPYAPKKLLGISELEKLLKKKTFNEYLSSYVVKPKGNLTIAPDSDDREEIIINKETLC